MADEPDAYKALQVDPEADLEVIQAAYRRLAQKYHPDVAAGPEAAARMIALNRAWEMLRDPERRAAYDVRRARVGRGGSPLPGSDRVFSPGTGRSAARNPAPNPGGGSGPPPDPVGRRRPDAHGRREPETVSSDWSSGRSSSGHAYDPDSMRTPDGEAAAGSPPGNPSGSTLNFGRYAAWSIGEIARTDLDYLEWLERVPIGRAYRDEIDAILRRVGRRRSAATEAAERRGLFRRR